MNTKKPPAHLEQEGPPPLLKSQWSWSWNAPRGCRCKMTVQEIISVVLPCAYRECSKKDHRQERQGDHSKNSRSLQTAEKARFPDWASQRCGCTNSFTGPVQPHQEPSLYHVPHLRQAFRHPSELWCWGTSLQHHHSSAQPLTSLILACGLTFWLDVEPTSPPQRCPMIWTLGWTQLFLAALLPAWGEVLPWSPGTSGSQRGDGPGSTLAKS